MAASSPPFQTPSKRKRGQETPLTPIKFTFSLNPEDAAEDGDSSPRTTVAHRFKGLHLQSGSGGGGVSGFGAASMAANDVGERLLFKRQKPDHPMSDVSAVVAETGATADAAAVPGESSAEAATTIVPADMGEAVAGKSGSPEPSRTRAGTPPLLRRQRDPWSPEAVDDSSDVEDDDSGIVDPVRAVLTWHEDEITIYDPDDKDDDGTGINGVGFRPTPAIAHARAMKRRQQITEYRKREESEARTRRNQRRREGEAPSRIGKPSPRKVHFSDSELRNIAVTTI